MHFFSEKSRIFKEVRTIEDSVTQWKEARRLYALGLDFEEVARVLLLKPEAVAERAADEGWPNRQQAEAQNGTRERKRLKRIADDLTKRTMRLSKEAESAKDIKDLTAVLKDLTAIDRNLQEDGNSEQQNETVRFVVEGEYRGD